MPCSFKGLIAIKNFENDLLNRVDHTEVEHWRLIFDSVRQRLIYGRPQSVMTGGDSVEEATVMRHMDEFIQRFRKPNFAGFPLDWLVRDGPFSGSQRSIAMTRNIE